MSAENTIRALLAGLETADPVEWRQKAARIAWVKETVAALRAAHKRVDEAWERIFDALPDDLDEDELEEIPGPDEQAEVDALHAQIRDVVEHDRWPRELYWSGI